MPAWIKPLSYYARDLVAAERRQLGGKGMRLAWLAHHGFSVPEAWVLSTEAFALALSKLPPSCDPKALLKIALGRAGYTRAAEAQRAIEEVELPPGLFAELEALWREHGSRFPWGLAVRSSATAEDGEEHSMAGAAETELGVFGAEATARAIRRVWASIASGRTLAYLASRGVHDARMAVVLQRVVPSDAAGVLYTRSPVSGERERIVNAGLGLGIPVVHGLWTPDMFSLDPNGKLRRAVIAPKATCLRVEGGGLVEVANTAPEKPSLGETHLAWLSTVARSLEALEDVVWDVEFSIEGDKGWVLQARPAKGTRALEGGDAETVWSNANVGEALPGVATPFTWSVAGAVSEVGFRTAFETLGCRVPKKARLLGNVHGRFYLNITEFSRIAAEVPYLDVSTMLALGGALPPGQALPERPPASRTGFYARLPKTLLGLLEDHLRIDERIAQHGVLMKKALRPSRAFDLSILPDDGLARKMRDLLGLLEQTGALMLTAASGSLLSFLLLKTLLDRRHPGEGLFRAASLTRGISDLESQKPAVLLSRVATLAMKEDAVRTLLETSEEAAPLPKGETRNALEEFLLRHGDRAIREGELSTPRWREDPDAVWAMLRAMVRAGGVEEGATLPDPGEALRDLSWFERVVVLKAVGRAKTMARHRETMRGHVTRVLARIRETALDAERRLLRLDPSLPTGLPIPNVFFMTFAEVTHALLTHRTDLFPIVRARRAEFARNEAHPDPPPVFVGAPPSIQIPHAEQRVLRGVAASAGVVEGPARVALTPEEAFRVEPGEILVTRTTDVGLTPLFLVAAGVVTEQGGPLSHASIVAREFSLPAVVNVPQATRLVRNGERIRIDGEQGVVIPLEARGP